MRRCAQNHARLRRHQLRVVYGSIGHATRRLLALASPKSSTFPLCRRGDLHGGRLQVRWMSPSRARPPRPPRIATERLFDGNCARGSRSSSVSPRSPDGTCRRLRPPCRGARRCAVDSATRDLAHARPRDAVGSAPTPPQTLMATARPSSYRARDRPPMRRCRAGYEFKTPRVDPGQSHV